MHVVAITAIIPCNVHFYISRVHVILPDRYDSNSNIVGARLYSCGARLHVASASDNPHWATENLSPPQDS